MTNESGFKSLKIWEKGMAITKEIYRLTRRFPEEERFGLTAQMRRAAVSIPSNIAEGYSRKSGLEFKQFLFIALGSLGELETQVLLAQDLGWWPEGENLLASLRHERFMILKICHRKGESK